MKEHSIMEMISLSTTLFLVLGICAVGIFFFSVQDVNSFRQTVNYQIERNGGLTPEAVSTLEEHSKVFFNGRFVVTSDQLNQSLSFGEQIDYTIQATFPIPFLPIPDMNINFRGTAVSHVR